MPRDPRGSSGARDRFIRIEQLTESTGTSGFPVEAWTLLAEVWAKKTEMRGNRFINQRFVQDQVTEPFDTHWELPYSASWDPELVEVQKKRRLVVRGRAHDIVWAGEIGRRDGVQVLTLSGGLVA